jgi:peptidoglycan/LPS O-acetylase OafA/YrhL
MLLPIPRTLEQCLERKQDNFLLLRFIAALMVIYEHSYWICGEALAKQDLIVRLGIGADISSGSLAVDMFFTISGFLVTGSYLKRDNLIDFCKSRLLRIVPAYAVCVTLCAFVIGLIYTSLPLGEYLRHPDTRGYVLHNMSFTNLAWTLPGVFSGGQHSHSVNVALWTLPAEARMYVYIALLGVLGILRRSWLANGVLLVFVVLGTLAPERVPMILDPSTHLRFAAMFAFGTFCYINRALIPVSGVLVLALAAACFVLHGSPVFRPLFGITVGYFCFWFAYATPWYGFNRLGDYSYGMYLWGYPVQQMIVQPIDAPQPLSVFFLSAPMALLIALLSWYLVEKPALRLKKWRWKTSATIAREHAAPASAADSAAE